MCVSINRNGLFAVESSKKTDEFLHLFAAAQPRVYAYIRTLLPTGREDAEEVLQETSVVLWEKFEEFKPGTNFVAWACRIAYYKALQFRQKQSRFPLVLSHELTDLVSQESISRVDADDSRSQALEKCLKKLKLKDRELLSLRYRQDGTAKAAAEAIGRGVESVRHSLIRIRLALLECVRRTLAAEVRP